MASCRRSPRVNRVFRDKPAGLIVDFIGVAQNLKSALGQYSRDDRRHAGIDKAEAIAVMLEKYEVVRDMFHGFDYRAGLTGSPQERLVALAGAIECDPRDATARRGQGVNQGRRRNERIADSTTRCSSSRRGSHSGARATKHGTSAMRWDSSKPCVLRLPRAAPSSGISSAERDLAVQQIVSRAVVSTEIIDILKAAGVETPDISILSDEFLAEVEGMEKKNLAMEALRKLINGEIRSRSRVNVVQTRAFSDRLEEAIARYHTSAITTAEVLQELIKLAKDIRAAHRRGEEEGLSEEEISFL